MATRSDFAEQEASFANEDTEQPVPSTDIVAYNELRSCADLVRMHASVSEVANWRGTSKSIPSTVTPRSRSMGEDFARSFPAY